MQIWKQMYNIYKIYEVVRFTSSGYKCFSTMLLKSQNLSNDEKRSCTFFTFQGSRQ